MIEAAIFDMDGLLVDSEPFWQQAELEVFQSVGVPMSARHANLTIGLRIDQVVDLWYRRYPWGAEAGCQQDIQQRIVDRMVELVSHHGRAKDGALQALDFFAQRNLALALASSSLMRLIEATLEALGLTDRFAVVYSAEYEPYGKPHPGVYISTANRLGVAPESCLALEDSLNGVIAAKAARMTCLLVPDPSLDHDPRRCLADEMLNSLAELDEHVWGRLQDRSQTIRLDGPLAGTPAQE